MPLITRRHSVTKSQTFCKSPVEYLADQTASTVLVVTAVLVCHGHPEFKTDVGVFAGPRYT